MVEKKRIKKMKKRREREEKKSKKEKELKRITKGKAKRKVERVAKKKITKKAITEIQIEKQPPKGFEQLSERPITEGIVKQPLPATSKPKKFDREFLFMFLLFIVAAVIVGWIVLFVLNVPPEENISSESNAVSVSAVIDSKYLPTSLDPKSCLARYGIEKTTVIFIYADDCVYSKAMMPIVEQLEKEGYSFYFANTANGSALQPVVACLKNIAQMSSTPEFVCVNNKSHVGTWSIELLRGFAEECKRS
jgi:hypothetical protein